MGSKVESQTWVFKIDVPNGLLRDVPASAVIETLWPIFASAVEQEMRRFLNGQDPS